ncbi:MAG: hypothetical protein JST22_06875 [Bacteroidetes bacterium]|nr:hypothetical protein [Bacteroidota bacterium]
MQYPTPEQRTDKPVTGEEARTLLAAIDAGEALANEAALKTAGRILARRSGMNANNGAEPIDEEGKR